MAVKTVNYTNIAVSSRHPSKASSDCYGFIDGTLATFCLIKLLVFIERCPPLIVFALVSLDFDIPFTTILSLTYLWQPSSYCNYSLVFVSSILLKLIAIFHLQNMKALAHILKPKVSFKRLFTILFAIVRWGFLLRIQAQNQTHQLLQSFLFIFPRPAIFHLCISERIDLRLEIFEVTFLRLFASKCYPNDAASVELCQMHLSAHTYSLKEKDKTKRKEKNNRPTNAESYFIL